MPVAKTKTVRKQESITCGNCVNLEIEDFFVDRSLSKINTM